MELKKKSTLSRISDWIIEKIRSQDYYGKPVMLTFNGEEAYNTFLGGFLSSIIKVIITAYMIMLINVMVYKDQTKANKNSLQADLTKSSDFYYIGQNGFSFALSLNDSAIDYLQDKSYVSLEMFQVSQVWKTDSNNIPVNFKTKIPIEFSLCNTKFNFSDQSLVNRLGINYYYCPNSNNYTVGGVYNSPIFNYLEVKLRKYSEINRALNSVKLSMSIINTYFDFSDFSDPINYFIDSSFYWAILPGFDKKLIYL